MRRIPLQRMALVGLVLLGLCASATAAWVAVVSGFAFGNAGALSTPSNVTATGGTGQSSVSVPVGWSASHVASGDPAIDAQVTYSVERSANGGATWGSAGGTCSGTLTGTSCNDTLTQTGSYSYRVTGHLNSWTASGTSSPVSVTVTNLSQPTLDSTPADPSANTAPSFSFSGGGGTGYECKLDAGSFAGCTSPTSYSGLSNGSHTFTVRSVLGASTGPDRTYSWTVDTSAPAVTSKPPASPTWSNNGSFAFSHTRAAYTFKCKLDSGSFTTCTSPKDYAAAIADGSHTFSVEAVDADGVGTQSTSPYTWLLDTAKPQTTASGTDNNWHKTAVTVGLSASDPGYSANPQTGSGVSQLHYKIDNGTQQNIAGSNGVAGTSFVISAPSDGSNDGDHTITYWSTDVAGNDEAQGTVHVKIDTQGPVHNLSLTKGASGGGSYLDTASSKVYYDGGTAGSFTLSDALTDAGSGPASVTYPAINNVSKMSHTGETITNGPSYTSTAFSWSNGATFGSTYTITAADALGNTRPTMLTFVSDTTNPTGSITYAPNGYLPSGQSVQVSLAAADGGSGVGATQLQRASAPLNGSGGCGSYGTFSNIAANPGTSYQDSGLASGNCYKYQYVVSDNVGNTATFTSGNVVKVDQLLPTVGITFPGSGGSYTVSGWKNTSGAACPGGATDIACGTAGDTGGSGIASNSGVEIQLQQNFGSNSCWNGTSGAGSAFGTTCSWFSAAGGDPTWTYGVKGTDFKVPAGQTQSFVLRARATDRAGNVSSISSTTFSISN